jgi:hypothetical protein
MPTSSVDRITFGPSLTGSPFTVERLSANNASPQELMICAEAMGEIILKSWQGKTDGSIPDEDLRAVIPDPDTQIQSILVPSRDARYWVTHRGDERSESITAPEEVTGFIRVEEWVPRFSKLKLPYPNITDIESRTGYIRGVFEPQAAALLYFALGEFADNREVCAFELEGSDGIDFYVEHGFKRQRKVPKQKVGNSEVGTVRLVCENNGLARASLIANFPWLDIPTLQ